MDNLNIRLSAHAREVMKEREVTFDEIAEVIARPSFVATDTTRSKGCRRYVKGDITVIVGEDYAHPEIKVVITVLWRRDHQWNNDEMKGRTR